MNLQQDIEFLKMFTFNSIEEMNNNTILQKYFDIKDDGKGAMEHIFKGYNPQYGAFVGYHTEYLFPNLYEATFEPNTNKNKPYIMNLSEYGKTYNTFFPISMSCTHIIVAILLAYKKYLQESNNKNIYVLEYHMYISLALTSDGKIFDAFPVVQS